MHWYIWCIGALVHGRIWCIDGSELPLICTHLARQERANIEVRDFLRQICSPLRVVRLRLHEAARAQLQVHDARRAAASGHIFQPQQRDGSPLDVAVVARREFAQRLRLQRLVVLTFVCCALLDHNRGWVIRVPLERLGVPRRLDHARGAFDGGSPAQHVGGRRAVLVAALSGRRDLLATLGASKGRLNHGRGRRVHGL